jgi:hypothetical protein
VERGEDGEGNAETKIPITDDSQPLSSWVISEALSVSRLRHPDRLRLPMRTDIFTCMYIEVDRLCGLVVRILGYRSGGPDSIPGTTRFSEKKKKRRKTVVGLERGPLSLQSTTEELLHRKVAAPV